MIYPPISDLLRITGNKYTLVVATAKRSRQLVEGAGKVTVFDSGKPVTLAVHELIEGKIKYSRKKQLQK